MMLSTTWSSKSLTSVSERRCAKPASTRMLAETVSQRRLLPPRRRPHLTRKSVDRRQCNLSIRSSGPPRCAVNWIRTVWQRPLTSSVRLRSSRGQGQILRLFLPCVAVANGDLRTSRRVLQEHRCSSEARSARRSRALARPPLQLVLRCSCSQFCQFSSASGCVASLACATSGLSSS